MLFLRLLLGALMSMVVGIITFRRRWSAPRPGSLIIISPPASRRAERALVFISVASLVTAVAVGFISWRQAEIAALQAELMRAQYLPVFQLQLTLEENLESPGRYQERLFVVNAGGQARDLVIGPMAFLEVREEFRDGTTILTRLPVMDYYGVPLDIGLGMTSNAQGELGAWNGAQPDQATLPRQRGLWRTGTDLINALTDQMRDVNNEGRRSARMQIVTYVDIKYRDVFNEGRRDVYRATPGGFGRLSDNEGYALMDQWNPITSLPDYSYHSPLFIRMGDTPVAHAFAMKRSSGEELFQLWKRNRELQGYPVILRQATPASPMASPSESTEGPT